jgi:hypothetical protein
MKVYIIAPWIWGSDGRYIVKAFTTYEAAKAHGEEDGLRDDYIIEQELVGAEDKHLVSGQALHEVLTSLWVYSATPEYYEGALGVTLDELEAARKEHRRAKEVLPGADAGR